MRVVPEGMAARIESGAATLCHAWLVTLADGTRLGFTDHDRALEVERVVCRADAGWTAGAADAGLGRVGTAAALGVVDADDEAAIEAGLWDGAEVELRRVDWSAPEESVLLHRGRVVKVRRVGARLEAEVEGLLARLERVAGRTFGRLCNAALGDARCRAAAPLPRTECDKRWRTCVEVFANGVNFQGFPDVPRDELGLWPGAGETHDGGSRR